MHFIIVGAGLGGLAAAWWVRHHGHQATLVERCATVAERASHALSGLALPTVLDPWFGPLAVPEPRTAWPWQRAQLREAAETQRREAALRLAQWSARAQRVIAALGDDASGAARPRSTRAADAAQSAGRHGAAGRADRAAAVDGLAGGLLYLFDEERHWTQARAVGEWLATLSPGDTAQPAGQAGPTLPAVSAGTDAAGLAARTASNAPVIQPPEWLSAAACIEMEPSLAERTGLRGAASFCQASSGNPAWLAKRLRHRLEHDGVRFLFGREATQVRRGDTRGDIEVHTRPARAGAYDGVVARGFVDPFARQRDQAASDHVLRADRVIVAGGGDGLALLAASSLAPPARAIATVHQAALTGPIGDEGHAPRLAIVDAGQRVAVTRLDRRIRVWGATLDKPGATLAARIDSALHTAPAHAMRVGRATRWQALACLGSDGLPAAPLGADPRVRALLAGASLGFALPFGVAAELVEAMLA